MKKSTLLLFAFLALNTLFYSSCGKDDPCELISCQNGGTCVNGACDCPEGFSGPDCSNVETPSKIRVTNIKVTDFPATDDNGGGWDLASGADIYVSMSYNNTNIYESNTYFQDADPQQDYDFQPNINLDLEYPTNRYVIRLHDYDDLGLDDYMGGIEFTPFSPSNGFPETLNIDAGTGLAFTLSLDYTF